MLCYWLICMLRLIYYCIHSLWWYPELASHSHTYEYTIQTRHEPSSKHTAGNTTRVVCWHHLSSAGRESEQNQSSDRDAEPQHIRMTLTHNGNSLVVLDEEEQEEEEAPFSASNVPLCLVQCVKVLKSKLYIDDIRQIHFLYWMPASSFSRIFY